MSDSDENDSEIDKNIEKIESEDADAQIDTVADYEIITYGADYTLSVLYEKMKNKEIVVPGFQRKYMWKEKQASRLVESFLLGLPVPAIFLAKEKSKKQKTGNLVVIDGQQRLKTCQAFRDGHFHDTQKEFRLVGVRDKWEGKTYNELSSADRKIFDDSVLRATIVQQVRPENDATSMSHIFQRLNTGGTLLRNQEIRNCLFETTLLNMSLHELNEKNNDWRELYGLPLHKRRTDEELILRFLALYDAYDTYAKPMNEFLTNYMEKNRNIESEKLQKLKSIFEKTIEYIKINGGPDVFRPKGNINTAVVDSIMYVVAKNSDKLKPDFKANVMKMFKDKYYQKYIRDATTDETTIKARFELAEKYLVR